MADVLTKEQSYFIMRLFVHESFANKAADKKELKKSRKKELKGNRKY